jgi:hypothetical protein
VPLDMELKSVGEGDIAVQTEQVYANMEKVHVEHLLHRSRRL